MADSRESIDGAPRELFLGPGASYWVGRADRVTSWCVADRINASLLISTAIDLVNEALSEIDGCVLPARIDPEHGDCSSLERRLVMAARDWLEGQAMIPSDAWQAADVTKHVAP